MYKSNFLKFVYGEIDYLTPKDLLDFVDKEKLDNLELNYDTYGLENYRFMICSKTPIKQMFPCYKYDNYHDMKIQFLNDNILGITLHHSLKESNPYSFIINKDKKEIIVSFDYFEIRYSSLMTGKERLCKLKSKNSNIDVDLKAKYYPMKLNKIIVDSLEGYKIIYSSELYKDLKAYLKGFEEKILRDNYNEVIEQIKENQNSCFHTDYDKRIKDKSIEFFIKNINNPLNIEVFYERFLKERYSYDDSISILVDWLYDKENLENILLTYKDEIVKSGYGKIYVYDGINKILNSKVYESDYNLCLSRELYKVLDIDAKTIRINGESYFRRWFEHYYVIGDYDKNINIKDINTISYKRKEIFNKEKFDKEFYSKIK